MSERPTPVPGAADGPDAGDSRAEKRDQTAEQEEKPAAIAAASRNAIQEAKNRKAAARARLAERRNASS